MRRSGSQFSLAFLAAALAISTSAPRAVAGFTYLGSPASKWGIGPNAASEHDFAAPDGPRSPGGATFSIVPPGVRAANNADNSHGSQATVAITQLGVSGFDHEDDYAAVFTWALDAWDAASGYTNLGRVADSGAAAGAFEMQHGHMGDIRVAAWELTNSSLVAHAFQPGTEAIYGPGGTIAGDLHFDVGRVWIDDPLAGPSTTRYDIYTVALHELGHALGLGHSSVRGAVMEGTYRGANRSLKPDDIAAIQALYGRPVPEPRAARLAIAASVVIAISRAAARGHVRQKQKLASRYRGPRLMDAQLP